MRTNGIWHDIPNTTHLREKWGRFKKVHNQMEEARPLNLLNIAAWLISTCSHPRPLCLHLGDCALALCIFACILGEERRIKKFWCVFVFFGREIWWEKREKNAEKDAQTAPKTSPLKSELLGAFHRPWNAFQGSAHLVVCRVGLG